MIRARLTLVESGQPRTLRRFSWRAFSFFCPIAGCRTVDETVPVPGNGNVNAMRRHGVLMMNTQREELLFRGYLFGRLREDRGFWGAALLALPPFLLVHTLLFATMSFPVALAATLLSLVISFPLARLYDAGEKTMWGPAILHAVVQGGIKVVDVPEVEMMGLATTWMAASMLIPWIAFVRRPRTAR